MKYAITEKKNHLAIHAIRDTRESAEKFINEDIPFYIQKGYFMDKTLTAESFEVVEWTPETWRRRRKRRV